MNNMDYVTTLLGNCEGAIARANTEVQGRCRKTVDRHTTHKNKNTNSRERARKGGADLRGISCTQHNMATHNQGGLISIIEKHTFMNNLPAGWTREPKDGQGGSGSMKTTEGGEFTVLVQGSDFQGRDNLFEINDADDLQAAREVIMRGPILTTVKCTKTYWTSSDEDSDREEEREYVVLLNTGNPRISSEIERAFELAERLTREGRNFRITISISESLKRYYNVNVKVPDDSHNAKAEFCDIYLTRGVNRPNCADSFFIYDSAAEICVWILCLPVCLISGFPYLCYKKCYKGVVEKSFLNQALPIVAYTGPLQAGYNLRSLLHSPAGI